MTREDMHRAVLQAVQEEAVYHGLDFDLEKKVSSDYHFDSSTMERFLKNVCGHLASKGLTYEYVVGLGAQKVVNDVDMKTVVTVIVDMTTAFAGLHGRDDDPFKPDRREPAGPHGSDDDPFKPDGREPGGPHGRDRDPNEKP